MNKVLTWAKLCVSSYCLTLSFVLHCLSFNYLKLIRFITEGYNHADATSGHKRPQVHHSVWERKLRQDEASWLTTGLHTTRKTDL